MTKSRTRRRRRRRRSIIEAKGAIEGPCNGHVRQNDAKFKAVASGAVSEKWRLTYAIRPVLRYSITDLHTRMHLH